MKKSVVNTESDEASFLKRSSYAWNTVSGILLALQSIVMLIAITHVCDASVAGIFIVSYSYANLFLNIGKYGMRNYQASDIEQRFRFNDYGTSRALTGFFMLLAALFYLLWSSDTLLYGSDKIAAVFLMVCFKLIDAVEDVFHADYQRRGRLDLGGKTLTLRLATSMVLFVCMVVYSGDLSCALLVTTLYTTLFFIGEVVYVKRWYSMPDFKGRVSLSRLLELLKTCFPLFLAAFLLFYIGDSPKYAIDAVMDDVAQAYYGYIAMPVFVVVLLSSFIYNPMVVSLAQQWRDREVAVFVKRFIRLSGVVMAITAVCVLLAWVAGVPVLNWLYNTDISPYFESLLVLVAGGGFLALAALFTLGITIIRFQGSLIWGYVVVAALALFGSAYAVENWGIPGASWIYFILMAILALWFGVTFVVGIKVKAQ